MFLGPLVLPGPQYVSWEIKRGTWGASVLQPISNRKLFRTVWDACFALLAARRLGYNPRDVYRLCRCDGTPLLTVQGRRLAPWKED